MVAGIGGAVLVGWSADVEWLKGPIPGLITMKANTAVAFLAAGVSLRLVARENASSRGRRGAQVLALLALLIGALSLVQYAFGTNLGIDELLFDDTTAKHTIHPGRLAPQTSLNFILLGSALLLLGSGRTRRTGVIQVLALITAVTSLFAVLGYAYGIDAFTTLGPVSPMALHTALAFLVLSLGVLAAAPESGIVNTIASPSAGGILARRLLPGALVVLPALGWLRLEGEKLGLYEPEVGVALLVLGWLLAFAALSLAAARALNRADSQSREASLAQQRLAAVVESSPDAIITKSDSGVVTSWNRGAERIYGYSADEAIGRHIRFLVPPERQGEETDILERVLQGQRIDHYETERVRRDGKRIDVSLAVAPVREGDGRIAGASVIARDITDHKRAERRRRDDERRRAGEELRKSESRLAESQELGGIGSWEWDVTTGELTWSEELYRIYGLDPAGFDPSYESFLSLVASEDRDAVAAAVEHSLATGERYMTDLRIVRPDGEHRTIHARGEVVPRSDGSPRKMVGTAQDITERVNAEREKEVLESRLRQAERLESVGQLAGGVAHDFNNLLAVILNYAAFVGEELEDGSPAREDVEEIKRAAERAAALTHQLLVFSRREVVKPEVLDLNVVLEDLEKLLHRSLGEQVDLRTRTAPDLWPVKADPGQIEQMLVNLAVNARDAMPGGGTLTIETANTELGEEFSTSRGREIPPGKYARITVADTGTGMNPQVAERVFEPFFTTKEKGQGTGLGLATVYGVIRQAGGHVDLYSEPGMGTVFKIYLPATDEAVDATPGAEQGSAPDARGETILAVEDEDAVRELTERILTDRGYTVLAAADAGEALRHWETHRHDIDMLLTDVVMPGMSGKDLAARMAIRRPDLKTLYVSGYTDDFIARQEVLGEGVSLLEKPFTADSLLRAVRDVLDGKMEKAA